VALSAEQREDMMSAINITPFTDVLLVLLIIFMVAATASNQNAFNIKLPKEAADLEDKPTYVIVHIATDNIIWIADKYKVDLTQVYPYLRRLKEERRTNLIIIKADQGVEYGTVITVMDHAKRAGLTRVALATQSK
jgi:biopolymer transport protein ExbD